MRPNTTTARMLVVGMALLTLLATLPSGAFGTGASETGAATGGTGHADGYNYTVQPVDDPESAQNTDAQETCRPTGDTPNEDEGSTGPRDCDPYDGHMPGDENASYAQFSAAGELGTENLTEVHWIVHADTSGDFDMSGCATNDAAVAGVDRGNDDPGYQTDEPLLTHAKQTYERENEILVEMYREDDLAGEPLALYKNDQIVARVEDCYTNPSEPGWYQWRGFANGTTADGDLGYIELYSHYFYICNCSSRQEAVNELGQPPGSSPQASSGDGGAPSESGGGQGTPTATPTPAPGGDETPTPTPGGDGPTATPTPDTGDDGGGDATPTDTVDQEQDTATPTPTATPAPHRRDGTPTNEGTTEGTTTDTATDTDGGDGGDGISENTASATPTSGDGPGFGVLAAAAGLIAAALLARRRD